MKKTIFLTASLVCCSLFATAQRHYSLEQILDSALHNNIAVRSARYDIEAARQQRKEAFTKYFPGISAGGFIFNTNNGMAKLSVNPAEVLPADISMTLAQILPSGVLAAMGTPITMTMLKNGMVGSVMATQPVFTGGRIVYGNRLAKVGEDVSRLQMQLSENNVEKTAESYFWQVATMQEKLNTVLAVEAMLADVRKDVDVAVRAGVAMRNDMLQVQLRQNEVASQKLTLQNNLSLMRQLLSQYCGLRDTSFSIVYDASVSSPLMSRQDHDLALLSRAEYKLMNKQVEAASLQRKMTIGENLPTVAVGAGYNYHDLLDTNHSFGMIYATVSVPLSDWWGGSYAIRRRKLEQKKAQEQLADNAEMMKIGMQNAWNNVVEAYQQLQIAASSIEQAEENLRLNRDYYRAGTSRMTDLLEAQMLYQQSRDKYTDAFADYHNRLLEYRQSVGL